MITKLIQIQDIDTEERVLRGVLCRINIADGCRRRHFHLSLPSFTAVVASPPLLTCPCSQPAHSLRRTAIIEVGRRAAGSPQLVTGPLGIEILGWYPPIE